MHSGKSLALLCLVLLGSAWADNKLPSASPKPRLHTLPTAQSHIERGARQIASLVHARELQAVKQSGVQGMKRDGALTDLPGFSTDRSGAERRIGGRPAQADRAQASGLPNDPLDAHRNTRPRSTVVGPATMPGKDSLTRQDSGGGTEYGSGSGSTHGPVWAERSTSRQSADGMRTWGSTSYRDYSGNHWRSDYADTRREDGTVFSKETVFDAHGEPVKTTVRESFYDGSATETTTTHATGEVKQTSGSFPEIFPARSVDPDAPGGGDAVAPRGWYNPITGAAQNPGLRTGNNQVNPGRADPQPQAAAPLRLNPRDLVINPAPDAIAGSPGRPRDLREGNPTIVDPPRPP
jgi:hypothetical protein